MLLVCPLRSLAPVKAPNKISSIHEELLRAEEARHFLSAIVESSQDSIATINFGGIITTWNKAAQDYGYRAESASSTADE